MPNGDWSVGELGRRVERLENEVESLRFVRIEEYEPRHEVLKEQIEANTKRLERLDWQVKVVLGGLAAGLLGYAGVTARGLM